LSNVRIGLGGSDHDFSAALMVGADVRVAIEQERLTRRKRGAWLWYESPIMKAINYCLTEEQKSIDDVCVFVSSDIMPRRVTHELRDYSIHLYQHHLCHAASAYMMLESPLRAGILVYDGYGSPTGRDETHPDRNTRETFSLFVFGPTGYKCIGQNVGLGFIEDDFPTSITNSIGMLWEMITSLIGYHPNDCGKTMGLSSYGVPRYVGHLEEFITYGNEIATCFRCATDDPAMVEMIEGLLLNGKGNFAVRADLAASLQAITNKTLLHCAGFFCEYSIDVLCLSGGCALNTVANSFLVENSNLNVPIMIPPYCGDSGIALGALWLEQFHRSGSPAKFTFRGRPVSPAISRPGRAYSESERQSAVHQFYPHIALDASITTATDLANVIAKGAIVGLFNKGSEIGPRALGGRSIIGDPRSAMTREKINRLIKGREPYRPLAPVVLKSKYDEYFLDNRNADPFMLKIAKVRESCSRLAPAVVHVDGTARVQVIPSDGDPFLIELLHAFEELTGVGILINTSFNRREEPIVESPVDALDAFLGMGLDGLYLDGEFYRPADSTRPNTLRIDPIAS
jgi:carbamoyltransferase